MRDQYVIRCLVNVLAVACVTLTGCVTTGMQAQAPAAPEHFVDYKPDWLYVLQPGDQFVGGTVVSVTAAEGQALPLADFKVSNSGGEEGKPIRVSFMTDGRIVYHGGEGKITKVSTGETVLLPFDRPVKQVSEM